jgi:hypothetical protein
MKRPSKRFLGCCELKSALSTSGFEYRDEDEDDDGEDDDIDESGRSNADELRLEDGDGCASAVRAANTA